MYIAARARAWFLRANQTRIAHFECFTILLDAAAQARAADAVYRGLKLAQRHAEMARLRQQEQAAMHI